MTEEMETGQEEKNYLLHMPTLVTDNILKFLTGTELLSLRRVCRTTKRWVSSSRRQCWDGYRLEIRPDYEGWQTFDDAVKSGLNVTSIFINNPGDNGMDIYNSPSLKSFISIYGPHIRKLKVQSFGTLLNNFEFTFFNSLTNLTELKLQVVDARQRSVNSVDPVRFPSAFKNLKVLKFGDIMSPSETPPYKTNYHWDLVKACPSLEFLHFPVASQDYEVPGTTVNADAYFQPLITYIKTQVTSPSGLTLRTLDLRNVIGLGEAVTVYGFPNLFWYLHYDFKDVIKVRNAYAEMMVSGYDQNGGVQPYAYSDACNALIESMNNLQPAVQDLELPLMTKLVIDSSSCTVVPRAITPIWSNLKTLSVLIVPDNCFIPVSIYTVLFKSRPRPSVQKVKIVFDETVNCEDNVVDDGENIQGVKYSMYEAVISSRTLVRNFFNLKILVLVRWNTKNVSFLKLWEGLGQLEELTIEDCLNFGNVALIGTDVKQPSFLKLQKLRKLRLKLDLMSVITDRVFRDVFAKMSLKEFYLQALNPFEKVTESGILSLLDGEFGKSIEKFPFKSWSLASLSFIEFKQLGMKFRSIL